MDKPSNNIGVIIGACFLFFLLLLFQVLPLAGGFLLMLTRYSPFKGLLGSPFVGLENLAMLFSSPAFLKTLLNTVKINLLYLAFVMVLAYFLALSLKGINKRLQNLFTYVFLVPLFIPGSVMARIVISWFQGTSVLVSANLFPLIYALMLAVKNVGIPTLFMLKTWQIQNGQSERTGFEKLMAPLAFVLIQCTAILNSDFGSMYTLINPMVYETSDVLDYYIYRIGFSSANYSLAQSAWFMQFLLQAIISIVIYFFLKRVIRWESTFSKSFNPDADASEKPQTTNPAGLILPMLFLFFILWFVFKPLIVDGIIGILSGLHNYAGVFFASYIKYIFIYGFIALAGVPISVVLARSTLVNGAFGKISRAFLVFMHLAGGMSIHQYIFIRNLGLSDIIFALVLYYIFPIANSLVLAVIISFKTHGDKNNSQGEIKIWEPAFILGLIQFIIMWGSEYIPLVVFRSQAKMPPVLLAKTISQTDPGNMILTHSMDLFIAILPIALFIIFRKYITEWILLAFTRIRGS